MRRLDRLFLPISLIAILAVFSIGVVMLVSTTPKRADGAFSGIPAIDYCPSWRSTDLPETLPNPELNLRSYDDVEKTVSLPLPVRRAFRESFVGITVHKSDGNYGGTGFVVKSREGIGVVTGFHVVADLVCNPPRWEQKLPANPRVYVYTGEDVFSADIVRYDAGKDLILLRLATKGVKKRPIDIDQSESVDPLKEKRFAFGVYADQQGVDRVGVVMLRKLWRSSHPPYGALIDYFGSPVGGSPDAEPVGALWGLVRYGFSGGCALNERGSCNGVLNMMRVLESATFYVPAAKLVEFLGSK